MLDNRQGQGQQHDTVFQVAFAVPEIVIQKNQKCSDVEKSQRIGWEVIDDLCCY